MEVGMREFSKNVYKWLDKCPLDLTVHGKVKYKLILADEEMVPVPTEFTYGCGCNKEAGKALCPKHGRV